MQLNHSSADIKAAVKEAVVRRVEALPGLIAIAAACVLSVSCDKTSGSAPGREREELALRECFVNEADSLGGWKPNPDVRTQRI